MSDQPRTTSGTTEPSNPTLRDLDPATYAELRKIASRLARRNAHATLTATALLHEVWIKLRKAENLRVSSRAHLAALVVKTAREVTADALRRRVSRKRRTDGIVDIPLDDLPFRQVSAELLLQVNEALDALEREDERMARLFEARYFARMSVAEIAEEFEIPIRSVERSLAFSRAWFGARLRSSPPKGDGHA
jgi:RNA polymerase sigma factor (TIGR02999 family)